jgi:hypothetical protein
MQFAILSMNPAIAIRMNAKTGNVGPPVEHSIGETEYRGVIEINAAARSIDIDLMICLFPAFEAYAAINDGTGSILFHHAPPAGIMSLQLPKGANRRIRSRLEDRDGDGIFELPPE